MTDLPLPMAIMLGRDSLHEKIAASHPALAAGQVWCWNCGATKTVDSAHALRHGWPKCCGETMRLEPGDISKPAK
jgi:hypothetical protein